MRTCANLEPELAGRLSRAVPHGLKERVLSRLVEMFVEQVEEDGSHFMIDLIEGRITFGKAPGVDEEET